MTSKSKFSLTKIIFGAFTIVPALFNFVGNFIAIAEIEARLAGRSLAAILFLSLFVGTLLASIWFCILGLFLIYLLSLQASWALSIFIILLINIIVLIIVGLIILRIKKNLLFPETRSALRDLRN